jgi:hypothetical protein
MNIEGLSDAIISVECIGGPHDGLKFMAHTSPIYTFHEVNMFTQRVTRDHYALAVGERGRFHLKYLNSESTPL